MVLNVYWKNRVDSIGNKLADILRSERNQIDVFMLSLRASSGQLCSCTLVSKYVKIWSASRGKILIDDSSEVGTLLFQRLAIAKEFGDKSAERRAYSNLGNAHIFLGEFDVAADQYK